VPRFINITFAQIDQSIACQDADVGLSGVEARRPGGPRWP
jgi:hypothetical protein